MMGGQLVLTLDEAWSRPGRETPAGSLMAVVMETVRPGSLAISNAVETVFTPTARQSVEDVAVMDDRIVASIYDNVRGRTAVFRNRGEFGWPETALPAPENAAVHLGSSSRESGRIFYSYEGFLTPPTLALADARAGTAEVLRAAPARFDASTHVVEQFEATSSDGTKIPYFVVRPKDLAVDGHAPTIIYGYGGFQVSKPPIYIPEMGRLWLENGGVYVNANIRGGGEFGPAWHAGSPRRAGPESTAGRTAGS
jgi:prolyl oligopeptidase